MKKKPGLLARGEQAATGNNPFAVGDAVQNSGAATDISSEHQEVYDSAMQMVGELLHANKEASDGILDYIDQSETLEEGVAEASDLVISRVEEAFQGQVPEELILHITDEVSDLLVEMAVAAGMAEDTKQFSERAKILSTLQIMEEYGVEQGDYESAAANYAPEDIMNIEKIMLGAKNG